MVTELDKNLHFSFGLQELGHLSTFQNQTVNAKII